MDDTRPASAKAPAQERPRRTGRIVDVDEPAAADRDLSHRPDRSALFANEDGMSMGSRSAGTPSGGSGDASRFPRRVDLLRKSGELFS